MSYNKPEVTALSAVKAIQTQNQKLIHTVEDALGPEFKRQTSAAYEGDE